MSRRRITIKPGRGARINGLPSVRNWRGNSVIVSGDFDFEIEELDDSVYVQVELIGSAGYRWTYTDPSRELQIGDTVEVPHGRDDYPWQAKVVAYGRGDWDGPTKNVTARIKREVLV